MSKLMYVDQTIDEARALRWLVLKPRTPPPGFRPCISEAFLHDLDSVLDDAATSATGRANDHRHLAHVVLAGRAGLFSLGGDLAAMLAMVKTRDVAALQRYASHACRSIMRLHGGTHPRVRTVALVNGTCLGGGMEMAMACDVVVAERGVRMGFPEAAFGSFAGVGAYSLLWRRAGQRQALAFLRDGRHMPSEQWHERGVVDVLVEPGAGRAAVEAMVEEDLRHSTTIMALARVRNAILPLSLRELEEVASVWTQQVMAFDAAQIETISALVQAQDRKMAAAEAAQAEPQASAIQTLAMPPPE